MITYEIQWFYS